MTPGEFSSAVVAAVRDAVADGEFAAPVPEHVPIKATDAGDYATPLPLRLAKHAGRPADEIAKVLAERLSRRPDVQEAKVTGPGFLTVTADTARIENTYGFQDTKDLKAPWPTRPLTFDNPGFRVRFAYARADGALRHAADLGIRPTAGPLEDERERRLQTLLADFPVRAELAVQRHDPRPLSRWLELIADAYHDVHEQCPALPKGDEPVTERHAARLNLARAARIVLNNGLRMLGETPDDRL